MLIQQLNRADAERVLIVVQNVDGGGSITTGMGVALVQTAASGDGISAVLATKAMSRYFVGVAAGDIAINAFGLVTAWGYAASVLISQSVGSWTITAGDVLQSGGTGRFTSMLLLENLSTMCSRYVIQLGAVSDTISNPLQYVKGLVRAM